MDREDSNPFVSAMLGASHGTVPVSVFSVFAIGQSLPFEIALFSLAILLIFVGLTWFFLYLACRREVGTDYAVKQLLLSILLTPVLLLGVIAMPHLVRSDFQKWRAAEMRNKSEGAASKSA